MVSTDFTGRLLVASPMLPSPEFSRTVILVLDHDDDAGTLGVVINRPLPVDVSTVLPTWQSHTTPPGRLFQGGPVARDSAIGLAVIPGDGEPDGVRRLIGGLGIVDLDTDPDVLAGRLAGLRIFVGYAGWSPGQLEAELDEDSWFVLEAEARDAFSDDPHTLWAQVLERQGGDISLVARFPESPELN